MESYRDVIDLWPKPSVKTLASDIGEHPNTVSKWRQRNNIPSDYWFPMLRAARKRKIQVDESKLVKLAHRNGSS